MALENLHQLLYHWDPVLVAQGLELARSLPPAERRTLARQAAAQPWQPSHPWQVLRLCAENDAAAERSFQDWLLACLDRAGHQLPPTADWKGMRRAAERYRAGRLSLLGLQGVVREQSVSHAPHCPRSAEGVRLQTLWRATVAAAEDLCEPEPVGGWRTPAMLERLMPDGWGRRALLTQAAALL